MAPQASREIRSTNRCQLANLDDQTRLLDELTRHRLRQALAELDLAAGNRPQAFRRGLAALHQEHATGSIKGNAANARPAARSHTRALRTHRPPAGRFDTRACARGRCGGHAR